MRREAKQRSGSTKVVQPTQPTQLDQLDQLDQLTQLTQLTHIPWLTAGSRSRTHFKSFVI